MTNGEGRGVMSASAFIAGEEIAEPGDSELVILADDHALRRLLLLCTGMGAVDEG